MVNNVLSKDINYHIEEQHKVHGSSSRTAAKAFLWSRSAS